MKYLWIVLAILAVLSPLMWLRPSPGQVRISRLRQRASQLGLRVQLVPAADAAEDDRRPSAVRYLMPLTTATGADPVAGDWVLLRSERRGRPSDWPGWRWLRGEAPVATGAVLARAVTSLPNDVQAISRDQQGLSVYWLEKGAAEDLELIYCELSNIYKSIA